MVKKMLSLLLFAAALLVQRYSSAPQLSAPSGYLNVTEYGVRAENSRAMPASFRHVVPGAFVGGLFLLAALGLVWHPALLAFAGLAFLYALAAFGLSFLIAGKTKWKLFPVLPMVLACFHIGYGYGFLRGILDFVVLHNAPQTQFVQLTREQYVKAGNVRP